MGYENVTTWLIKRALENQHYFTNVSIKKQFRTEDSTVQY